MQVDESVLSSGRDQPTVRGKRDGKRFTPVSAKNGGRDVVQAMIEVVPLDAPQILLAGSRGGSCERRAHLLQIPSLPGVVRRADLRDVKALTHLVVACPKVSRRVLGLGQGLLELEI